MCTVDHTCHTLSLFLHKVLTVYVWEKAGESDRCGPTTLSTCEVTDRDLSLIQSMHGLNERSDTVVLAAANSCSLTWL